MTDKVKAKPHRLLPLILLERHSPLFSHFFSLSLFFSPILRAFFLFPKTFCSSREGVDQGFSLWVHLESQVASVRKNSYICLKIYLSDKSCLNQCIKKIQFSVLNIKIYINFLSQRLKVFTNSDQFLSRKEIIVHCIFFPNVWEHFVTFTARWQSLLYLLVPTYANLLVNCVYLFSVFHLCRATWWKQIHSVF